MIRFLNITKISWITFFVAMLASFIMASLAYAQETPAEIAKKYGITFPIAGFGNCQDYSSCYTFCEDPINTATCKAFFKAKGIYQDEVAPDEKVAAAKVELGCDSDQACEAFCQRAENYDKCDAFVSKFRDRLNLKGGYVKDPAKFVGAASQLLGCNSYESCQAFCATQENRQKCDEFTSQVGCKGGIEHKGPGGCNSEATCRDYCSDPENFTECSNFAPPSDHPSQPSHFKGPGGCDSEESCRFYCEQNPHDCKIITAGGPGLIDPTKAAEQYKKFCQANPGKCAQVNVNPFSSAFGRAEFERFCEANPEKCSGGHEKEFEHARKNEFNKFCEANPRLCQSGPGGYQIPKEFHGEGGFIDPDDYCRKYPDRCTGGRDYNPEKVCRQSPNCKWENNTCYCSYYEGGSQTPFPSVSPYPTYSSQPYPTHSPYTFPTPTPIPTSGNTPQPSSTPISDGTQPTPTPAPIQSPFPQPTATGNTDIGSSVKGISAVRSLFQNFLNFLR